MGSGSAESGAQCPVSSLPNELFQDVFDGPSFTLPDISTPNGLTFHEGVGFLMANEGWTGGPCSFDPASGLADLPCPQNLLSNFSGPGLYIETGHTSHPNSTFIPVAQVPEDLTTVIVAGQEPGGWIHSSTASVTLSSQPPVLAGTNLPGAATFVAAPIQSITYGISAANNVPAPASPAATDSVVENTIPCPSPANPLDPPATVFATPTQSLSGLADGSYLLHYYAEDCAGTEELKFTKDASGNWSTSYYTVPINIDTIAPMVASGPVLSPAVGSSGSYAVGQAVTATYSCTDERSGIVRCGSSTYLPNAAMLSTGAITSRVDTSTPGTKTYTVTAMDAAGNQSSASIHHYVVSSVNLAPVRLRTACWNATFPYGLDYHCGIYASSSAGPPRGVVTYQYDGGSAVSLTLHYGFAFFTISRPQAGSHNVVMSYAAQTNYAAANPVTAHFTVTPAPGSFN